MANLPQQGNAHQPRNLAQLIASLGPQSGVMQTSKVDPRSLAAGIQPSFAVVTFKGKTWSLRYRGNDNPLLVRDPQTGNILGAVPTIDVIIIRSAIAISKTFYLKEFTEGSFAPPDCWSTNGVTPDPAVRAQQNPTCPSCKWNAFGSSTRKIEGTDQIVRGKRCADNKRLAVVPAGDIKNEAFGGPMLLRLPPTTFSGLSELEAQLHMQGYHYSGVVMRCSFDHEASHPKIIFTPIRVLNDHEAQEIVVMQDSPIVERILNEEIIEVTGDAQQAAAPQAPVTSGASVPPSTNQGTPSNLTVQHHPSGAMSDTPVAATTAFNPGAPPATPPVGSTSGVMAGGAFQPQQELPPPVQMTPEQRRIAELEAALEQAKGGKRRTTKRSNPVTPMGGQPAVQVQPPPEQGQQVSQPFTAHAQPPAGGAPEADEGDAPADLDSRIDALLKPNGGATN